MKAGPFKTSTLTISDSFPINKSHQGPSQRLPTQTLRTLGYFDPLTLGQLVPVHRSTMHCVNQNEGRTLPNIKTDHYRQLYPQSKPSGSLPGASDQVSENLRFCHFQSAEIDFSMLSLIFQKLMRFPNSFASVQEVTWVQFCPKQLVSISSRRIDLIPPAPNFHLSVPNPKSQNRHAYALEIKNAKKKCLQMNQQEGRTLKNIMTDHSRQLFLQTKPSRTLPEASYQISKNLRFCQFQSLEIDFSIFSQIF